MKLITFYTKSHQPLKERFAASLLDDFDVVYQEADFTAALTAGGGMPTWEYKTTALLQQIRQEEGKIIIFSDIDIIFFKKVEGLVNNCIKDKDIVFQREYEASGVNIGFMAIRCNTASLKFWETVLSKIRQTKEWDQVVVNQLLYQEQYDIRWGRFPQEAWSFTQGFSSFQKMYKLEKKCHIVIPKMVKKLMASMLSSYPITNPAYGGTRTRSSLDAIIDKRICLYHTNCFGHIKNAVEEKMQQMDVVESFMKDKR